MKMSTSARKRLLRDFKMLQQVPPAGISGAPQDDNIMLWNAVIFGPDDTPWDGGMFKLTLLFEEDYPNKPPTVHFVFRMFHPNIRFDLRSGHGIAIHSFYRLRFVGRCFFSCSGTFLKTKAFR